MEEASHNGKRHPDRSEHDRRKQLLRMLQDVPDFPDVTFQVCAKAGILPVRIGRVRRGLLCRLGL